MHSSSRKLALTALCDWRHGRRFADAIVQQLLAGSSLGPADRSFVLELFYGVLRHLTLLDFWIGRLRSGALDYEARDLLRLGLYQLFCLATPAHAAVNETVALAGPRRRSLINGVLRNAIRRREELQQAAESESLAVRASHPEFLIERWSEHFGAEAARALCEWNNHAAPVYGRINALKISPAQFLAGHPTSEALSGWKNFVRLKSIPKEALARGECYIQDPSTSLACELLAPQPGETVLDACAAPGGKSGLLGELMEDRGLLVACDRDPARLATLRENLERLGITNAKIVRQDWTSGVLAPEFQAGMFDRILVDAPCSNTGVMRRRVDVRWRLKPNDFSRMPDAQFTNLRSVVPLLKPGGVLVYSTCSLEPEENEAVVKRALHEFPVLRLEEQKSVLPFRDQVDGAFAARLIRST